MRQQAGDDLKKARIDEKKELETIMEAKECEHRKAIEDIIKEKESTIKNNQDDAKNERLELLRRKDIEFQNLLELEREKIVCKLKDEMDRNIRHQRKEEKRKIDELRCQIARMQEENQDEKQSLLDEIVMLKRSADESMKTRVAEIQRGSQRAVKNEVAMVSQRFI